MFAYVGNGYVMVNLKELWGTFGKKWNNWLEMETEQERRVVNLTEQQAVT